MPRTKIWSQWDEPTSQICKRGPQRPASARGSGVFGGRNRSIWHDELRQRLPTPFRAAFEARPGFEPDFHRDELSTDECRRENFGANAMNQLIRSVNAGPEGRQAIAPSERAESRDAPKSFGMSEGPTHGFAWLWPPLPQMNVSVLRASLAAIAFLSVVAAFAQQRSNDESTVVQKAPPALDLKFKKQEIEGQQTAAEESLAAVRQQLTAKGLTPQERVRLEAEEAKLRPQIKS